MLMMIFVKFMAMTMILTDHGTDDVTNDDTDNDGTGEQAGKFDYMTTLLTASSGKF